MRGLMSGRIFINYRRGDDPGFTGRLFDRLEQTFPPERLFIDVDSIDPGEDFVRVLQDQVDQCDVLLAVIGRGWLEATDENGKRRLQLDNDFVRIEIESALKLGKRVIPVLVNNADMPKPDTLPETLKPLTRRNAVRLTHDRFKADTQGLIKVLEGALEEAEAARTARTEAERRAAEEAARKRTEEESSRALEAERQAEERIRAQGTAGMSATELRKLEELANWNFIEKRGNVDELRNHLARFPGGVTELYTRTALEVLVWTGLGNAPSLEALNGYLAEFPNGANFSVAKARRDRLQADADAMRALDDRLRRETDAWAKASSTDTVDAYDDFLISWPQSKNASAARTRKRKLLNPAEGKGIRGKTVAALLILGAVIGGFVVLGGHDILGTQGQLMTSEGANPRYGASGSAVTPVYSTKPPANDYCSYARTAEQCDRYASCRWIGSACKWTAIRSASPPSATATSPYSGGTSTATTYSYEAKPSYSKTSSSLRLPAPDANLARETAEYCASKKKRTLCESFPRCKWTGKACSAR